jgi:hypothetical protein
MDRVVFCLHSLIRVLSVHLHRIARRTLLNFHMLEHHATRVENFKKLDDFYMPARPNSFEAHALLTHQLKAQAFVNNRTRPHPFTSAAASPRPNTRDGDGDGDGGGGAADGQRSPPAAPMGRRSHASTRSYTETLARLCGSPRCPARLARWRRREFQSPFLLGASGTSLICRASHLGSSNVSSSRPFSLAPPGPRYSVGASHLGSPKCEC